MNPARLSRLWLLALVCSPLALGQVTTYTWTGNAASVVQNSGSANAADAGNWAGQQAPVSSISSTALQFGASAGLDFTGQLFVGIPDGFAVHSVSFTDPMPIYFIGNNGSLGVGTGGVTVGDGTVFVGSGLLLGGDQTWNIGGAAYVEGVISDDGGNYGITKTGTGYLVLNNPNSTFSGGVDVQAGSLFLGADSSSEGSTVYAGPVGTGTLTLRNGTELRTNTFSDVSLGNTIRLGTNVTLGHEDERNGIYLYGDINPLNAQTTLLLGAEDAIFLGGDIGDAVNGESPTATTMTFTTPTYADSLGFAVLTGQNTYSGGTVADRAAVIFYTSGSVPAVGAITARNGGYVSTGYDGGMADILAHITDPLAFDGSLGFDTDPNLNADPTVFNDTIDLSAFAPDTTPTAGFWGLGTQSRAIITGQITAPEGGNYVFGGGEGTLYVNSALGPGESAQTNGGSATPVGVRVRSVFGDRPLTVWLQGNNSFTGNLLSDHSVVVLNSASALPAGSLYGMDSQAYVGYTENTGFTPTQFIARLQIPSYSSDSVLGFDSADGAGRTISDLVDLSALGNIYIGSATHAHLAGAIRAPSTGTLSVVGVKGGWLTIDSALTPTVSDGESNGLSGVTSLRIGMNGGSDSFAHGIVELTSGDSTFAGGTTLLSGYTVLGASSTGSPGAPTAGPLGTGLVTFASGDYQHPPTLVAGTIATTLHNNIVFDNHSSAQFGAPFKGELDGDDDDPATRLGEFLGHGLHLAGNLSGTAGHIQFSGGNIFQLSGDNSALHAGQISIGRHFEEGSPLVIVGSNSGLGNTNSSLWLAPGADLAFNTPLPAIGTIGGGDISDLDTANVSHLTLLPGSTLTIHQHYDAELAANIGGTTEGFAWNNNTTLPTTAALVKNGLGDLTLSGENRYGGGTTINAGRVIAAGETVIDSQAGIISGPLGTGTVTLAGGALSLENTSFYNPIVFSGSANVLGGTGSFHTPITAGNGVIIAPGNSPGVLDFAAGLTWAGGGVYSVEILSLTGTPGIDSDLILVSDGNFTISATAQNPFTIQLNSLASLWQLGPLGDVPTSPVSLVILQANAPITGIGANFDNFVLNSANFTSPGTFALAIGGANNTQLLLNYTPGVIPEPSTYALLGVGLLAIFVSVRRRNRPRA